MYVSVFAYAHHTEAGRGKTSGVAAVCCVFWAAVRTNIDIITAGPSIKKERRRGETNKCAARPEPWIEMLNVRRSTGRRRYPENSLLCYFKIYEGGARKWGI